MKANEVPEKIYLPIDDSLKTYARKDSDEEIEYTRTDAFIEKAKKWFEEQNKWRDMNGVKHCDMESFDEFKKYMEGE